MNHKIHNIHMIGIGGAGMSGIAEILLQQGYNISGSDLKESCATDTLRNLGATIYIGHRPQNLGNVQVVVRSTAIRDDNLELQEAVKRQIPVIPRAEMLAELMRLRQGIAIAGTHGKTTTTSLVSAIFEYADKDPTVIIGGKLNTNGKNSRPGKGEYLIAEADESDGSFLCLFPIVNIITNVDDDHLDHYGNREEIDKAFIQFMNKVPFYGLNVVCGDDKGIEKLMPFVKRPLVTYGFNEKNDFRAEIIKLGKINIFNIWHGKDKLGTVHLPQPGKHNILNALGAVAVAMALDIPFAVCAEGLKNFKGVGRRFEWKGEKNNVSVIDDYGHHPAEISATLSALKEVFPDNRLIVAFQPHRFTRTQSLFGEFCKIFDIADELLVTEIYAASENPIPGVSGESLTAGIRQVGKVPVTYFATLSELVEKLDSILKPGDIFLTLGAGSITTVGPAWLSN